MDRKELEKRGKGYAPGLKTDKSETVHSFMNNLQWASWWCHIPIIGLTFDLIDEIIIAVTKGDIRVHTIYENIMCSCNNI